MPLRDHFRQPQDDQRHWEDQPDGKDREPMKACPCRSELEKMLADQLGREAEKAVLAHVATCSRCRKVLEELNSIADPRAAGLAPPDVTQAEPARKESDGRELPAAFGRYRLLKRLGKGNMGEVYLAHDTQLNRTVALKMPQLDQKEGSRILARFYREARAAALHHPNICPLHDVGEVDGLPYLTMGYIEGKTLAEFVRTRPLQPRQSALLVRKLALALQEAHKRGVIHRDLKPANIMIDRRGEPIIMDFGLARRAVKGEPQLTEQGTILGTPEYMAPEQGAGDLDAIGPACDIYSLGVILYELLAGRTPFTGDLLTLLSQVKMVEPPPPSRFRPDLDPELEAICLKALAKKIDQRPKSMADLAAALSDYLRSSSTVREEPAAPEPVKEPDTQADGIRVSRMGGLRSVALLPARMAARDEPRPLRRRQSRHRRVPPWVWLASGGGAVLMLLLGVFLFGQMLDSPGARSKGGVPSQPALLLFAARHPTISEPFNLFLVKEDGSGLRKLTDHPANNTDPAWSPDGLRIAFVSDRTGRKEIHLMDADGKNVKQLTDVAGDNRLPSWSPDGEHISFASNRDGNAEIYVLGIHSAVQTNLTRNPAWDTNPAWSPDGGRFAFDSDRRSPKQFRVYVMDKDGKNVRDVSGADNPHLGPTPAWSPDGKRILACLPAPPFPAPTQAGKRNVWRYGQGIFKMTKEKKWLEKTPSNVQYHFVEQGRTEKYVELYDRSRDCTVRLHEDRFEVKAPFTGGKFQKWHDGAFEEAIPQTMEIVVLDAGGPNQKQLTSLGGRNDGPAWSADGKRIAFWHRELNPSTGKPKGEAQLYIMNADGSNPREILMVNGGTRLAWKPNP
jgi:serine/threonine protein kinase/Tol biopolymer transport system component